MNLKSYVKDIPDYPKPGILFRDIQPLLADPKAFEDAIFELYHKLDGIDFDYIVGIEARGFIIGQALAWISNSGFKMIRKKGKLPPEGLSSVSYKLEYGEATIEMQKGSGKVVLVDDVLATGGTMEAAELLCKVSGYEIVDKLCLVDIGLYTKKDIKCIIEYECK